MWTKKRMSHRWEPRGSCCYRRGGKLGEGSVFSWTLLQPNLKLIQSENLMAFPQRGKVRLILNVSLPVNKSLNSNIKKECMEKVSMCSCMMIFLFCNEYRQKSLAIQARLVWCLQKYPMQNVLPQIARFQVADQNTLLTRQVFDAEASAFNFDTLRNKAFS